MPFHNIKDAVSFSSMICLTFLSLNPTYSAVSCTDNVYFSHHGIDGFLNSVISCSSVSSMIVHSPIRKNFIIIAPPDTAMLRYFLTNNPYSISKQYTIMGREIIPARINPNIQFLFIILLHNATNMYILQFPHGNLNPNMLSNPQVKVWNTAFNCTLTA